MLVNMIKSQDQLSISNGTGSAPQHWPFLGNRSVHQAGRGARHAPSGLHPATLEYLAVPDTRQKFVWFAEECRHNQVVEKLAGFSHLKIVNTPEAADIALLDHVSNLNILSRLPVGKGNGLNGSATVIIQVEEIYEYDGVSFRDPDTGRMKNLNPVPLPRTFWHFRERVSSSIDTGLDFMFTSPTSLYRLPRSIQVVFPSNY